MNLFNIFIFLPMSFVFSEIKLEQEKAEQTSRVYQHFIVVF